MQLLGHGIKTCEDPNSSKKADKIIIANEHPNNIIDATQWKLNIERH